MERSKLKLGVIFLLVVMNLFLLGSATLQHRQNILYRQAAVTEAMTYLGDHGVTVKRDMLPWTSALPDSLEKLRPADGQFLMGDAMPEGESYLIQNARRAETLAVALANGLTALGVTEITISSVSEGYRYDGIARTLTPVWLVETDRGAFLLDCSQGTLTAE